MVRLYVDYRIDRDRIELLRQLASTDTRAAAIIQALELLEWMVDNERRVKDIVAYYRLKDNELYQKLLKSFHRWKLSMLIITIVLLALILIVFTNSTIITICPQK